MHTNGVHAPVSGNSETIVYAGRTMEFKHSGQLNWLGEETATWMIEQTVQALSELINNPVVSSIDYCPRSAASR